ncbi:COBW domain-containing protein [Tieghemostelium lacteum]|uniref:COBW domain-containing protein n=1 Tax=Tieghemostelium lacteum TaxID=361077 RepID=A0A151ZH11_TIELA|nr:COBW domain-containing protein [Tieghemostelium lacteum]|eukprot:KYQ93262.1 COBW domain-containing protein [Tieghemostelium lacteum]
MSRDNKIPITLITGFLGAGKSTFLSYILNENHGKKIAVIQNEFGESIGVETAIIVGDDGKKVQEWLEFPNGCICCTSKDDFLQSIEDLLKRKDKFDYILIESTGMGDPGQISTSLWVDEELDSPVYLDSIIAVVDCFHFEKQLENANQLKMTNTIEKVKHDTELERQIAFADVVLLNKIDLVDKTYLQNIKSKILDINSMAEIYTTERSKIDLNKVLGIKSYTPNLELIQNYLSHHKKQDSHNHNEHNHSHSNHSTNITTLYIEQVGDLDETEFNRWLGEMVYDTYKDKIYRYKGLLSINNENEKFILQGVYSTFEVQSSHIAWNKNEEKINRLVFIGESLDYNQIKSKIFIIIK